MLGVRVLHSDSSVTTRYFHTDNLGSIAVITNESGAVVERDSYDAWGKRRFPTGADDPSGSLTSQTTRGFTGQEELADVGLVHLNGRVYDPLIGRMMSADPTVPDAMNGQAWNRYSYVANNPLAFIDPNGYSWLSSFFHAIGTFFNRTFGVLFREFPILGNLFELAAMVAICGPAFSVCSAVVAGLSTTFVAGVTSGNLGYALKAGLIAGVTAIANFAVGTLAQGVGGMEGYLLGAAGHALVGCVSAIASAGNCGPAALAGGISSLSRGFTNGYGGFAGLVMNAVVGGLASVAGGGKFANGAVTAAFAYLTSPQSGSAEREPTNADASLNALAAETYVGWDGKIYVVHYPVYDKLTWQEQLAVDAHEGIHVEQLLPFAGQGWWGKVQSQWYIYWHGPELEIPAYSKEIEFYSNYIQEFQPPRELRQTIQRDITWANNMIANFCYHVTGTKPSGC
jgi:RHS repeat-associated protein